MPPSDDDMQAITDAASSTNSCSVELTSSAGDDCPGAVISTNSCPISKNSELISVLENDPIESENKEVLETSEGKAIEEAACVPEKESEEEEQRQDSEDSTTKTQQNENSEADQSETIATKEDKETETDTATEETTETTDNEDEKPEQEDSDEKEEQGDSSEEPKSESTPPPNPDDDIEWLSPFSMPRVKEDEEDGNKDASEEEGGASSENNPLKMLKKGAVAAVGGSMVGLGLVMIPLPTPFGAVVASSGLAVLGTEFNEAKDLNDRLIGGAKGHLNKARESIVKGIEKMNEDELDAEVSSSSNNETLNTNKSGENEGSEAGSVIKVNAVETLGGDSKSDDSENSETGSASESPPVWLHMNPIERQRQERLAKQKYRRDRQTSYEQAKEAFTKRTGKFLSKNLLPLIKKAEPSEDAKEQEVAADGKEQTTDIDDPTTVSKTDEESESISIIEKVEDSETTENETTAELEKEEDYESCKIETNDNDSEGYVVVS